MDVRRRLMRWALAHPRVLLVDTPGTRSLRWQVEAELDRRHWPLALSPADTDLLLVLGQPGPQLAAAVDVLWSQTTTPRHRCDVDRGDDACTQLDAAVSALTDATSCPGTPQPSARELLENRAGDQRDQRDQPGQHAASGHEGHQLHDGGEVAGLAMADMAPDRDGLVLDSLQVSLGPVLPGWPTGLVVQGALQGDVLTNVEARWADAGDAAEDGRRADAGSDLIALDHLARFLLVAGWPTAARAARIARSALSGPDPERAAQGRRDAARLVSLVCRSRTLAWSVRGLGVARSSRHFVGDDDWLAGDVLTRVRRWCDLATGDGAPHRPASGRPLADVAVLLEGTELAAARLVVASVDLHRTAAGEREAAGA